MSAGTIANFQEKKLKAKILILEDENGPKVLLVESRTSIPPSITHALRVKATILDQSSLDLSESQRIKHPLLTAPSNDVPSLKSRMQAVSDSWTGACSYVAEDAEKNIKGLRNPQFGAIHSIHGHWTVSDDVATIVMPTGTGKTETMLGVLVSTPCDRVLVIVPTDALRTQLAQKFLTLGILKDKDSKILLEAAQYPSVGVLRHKPKDVSDVDAFFSRCHVIVTTSQIAGLSSDEIQGRMSFHCPYLFIDEAHHVEARTWRLFKERFQSRRVLQFTATPFREDGKPLDGKIVYKYPLKRAQEDGYFKQIEFEQVWEFNPTDYDKAIAERAVEQLRRDQKYGHILMARVETEERATEVFPLYERYAEFKPVQIHTGIKSIAKRDEIRRKIINGESKIVVCVDMLGEGFDLPELKIAAFHDIKKSLAADLTDDGYSSEGW